MNTESECVNINYCKDCTSFVSCDTFDYIDVCANLSNCTYMINCVEYSKYESLFNNSDKDNM